MSTRGCRVGAAPVAVGEGLRRADAERMVEEGGAEVAWWDVGLHGRPYLEAAVLRGFRVGGQRARDEVAVLLAQVDLVRVRPGLVSRQGCV